MLELQSQDDLTALTQRYHEATHASNGLEKQVQGVMDDLDEALEQTQARGALYEKAVQTLCRWSRTSGRLPSSCTLAVTIELESQGGSLSSSTLSDVYRGYYSSTLVAVKALRVHVDDQEAVRKSFKNEIVVWKCLRHPNIVPFLGISDCFPVCVVSGWMSQGTIFEFFSAYPNQSRSPYILQIISGLEFMHTLDVIHGGLKSANILIDADHNARLADFGLATVLFNASTQSANTVGEPVTGTIRFMAPELLSEGKQFNVLSDVYALAITIWELFAQDTPYKTISNDRVVMIKVLAGQRPTRPEASANIGFTKEVWDVIQRGWAQEPELRPALSDFLQAVAPDMPLRRDSAFDPRQRLLSERKRTLSAMRKAPGTRDTALLLHEPAAESTQQPARLDAPDPDSVPIAEAKKAHHLREDGPRREEFASVIPRADVARQDSDMAPASVPDFRRRKQDEEEEMMERDCKMCGGCCTVQ